MGQGHHIHVGKGPTSDDKWFQRALLLYPFRPFTLGPTGAGRHNSNGHGHGLTFRRRAANLQAQQLARWLRPEWEIKSDRCLIHSLRSRTRFTPQREPTPSLAVAITVCDANALLALKGLTLIAI